MSRGCCPQTVAYLEIERVTTIGAFANSLFMGALVSCKDKDKRQGTKIHFGQGFTVHESYENLFESLLSHLEDRRDGRRGIQRLARFFFL